MGSCAGSPQGSWTRASAPLGPQHLEEPASCCGCGWGPRAYPCSPHPAVSQDPQGCPRSATRICGAHPGPRRPHAAVRGLAQPGARIQAWPGPWGVDPISLCVGPGGGSNHPSPHRAQGQASPGPSGLGAGVLCRVCCPPGGTVGGGRAQVILCSTHLHPPCRGLPVFPPPCNPWIHYGTPGF